MPCKCFILISNRAYFDITFFHLDFYLHINVLGNYNKIPKGSNNRNYFSHGSEGSKSKVKVPRGSFLDCWPFWFIWVSHWLVVRLSDQEAFPLSLHGLPQSTSHSDLIPIIFKSLLD